MHLLAAGNLGAWFDLLSHRLGRSSEQLAAKGLGPADFPATQRVELAFQDGIHFTLRAAFLLEDVPGARWGVFSRSSGSWVLSKAEVQAREFGEADPDQVALIDWGALIESSKTATSRVEQASRSSARASLEILLGTAVIRELTHHFLDRLPGGEVSRAILSLLHSPEAAYIRR